MPETPRDDHLTADSSPSAARRRIRNRALAIGVSVTPFGLSFGAVSVEAHLSLVEVCLLSLVLFLGRFAVRAGEHPRCRWFVSLRVGTALLLGVRNGLYGLASTRCCAPPDGAVFVMAEVTIDESTAMAVSEAPSGNAARAFLDDRMSVYVLWNVSTVIGALVGNALGSPATTGLDVAGPAAFIALLAPRLTTVRMRVTALGSGAIGARDRPDRARRSADSHRRPDAVALLLVLDR